MTEILITTTETVPERRIKHILGLVEGSTIQTRHLGTHIMAGLQTLVGGKVKGYVRAVREAREEATSRMLEHAKALGAHAVVSMRYSTSQIMSGGAEILAYGTAVELEDA